MNMNIFMLFMLYWLLIWAVEEVHFSNGKYKYSFWVLSVVPEEALKDFLKIFVILNSCYEKEFNLNRIG